MPIQKSWQVSKAIPLKEQTAPVTKVLTEVVVSSFLGLPGIFRPMVERLDWAFVIKEKFRVFCQELNLRPIFWLLPTLSPIQNMRQIILACQLDAINARDRYLSQ